MARLGVRKQGVIRPGHASFAIAIAIVISKHLYIQTHLMYMETIRMLYSAPVDPFACDGVLMNRASMRMTPTDFLT
jgi:hypothetical protein